MSTVCCQPLCLQQRLDGGRVYVLAVTDDLGVGLGA